MIGQKSVKDIKEELQRADEKHLEELLQICSRDDRSAVQKLAESAKKKLDALDKERKRIDELKRYEKEYSQYTYICGIDEVVAVLIGTFTADRAGICPVVAGAVILPKDCDILYINDSKKLSEKKREELYDIILEKAVSCAVGYASPERIDEINILQATYEAMRDLLLNDAVNIPRVSIPQVPIIKGDAKSISIGAASIIAKVTRDRLMVEYDKVFPEYGFAGNKGYGSAAHIEALKKYGPTPIHRRSFIGHFV